MRIVPAAITLIAATHLSIVLGAQNPASKPRVELRSAPRLDLPGDVDSNSPAVWDRAGGRNLLFVLMSESGRTTRATGRDLTNFGLPRKVTIEPWPGGGVWMEAVIKDAGGAWYGYYHNEIPADVCGRADRVIPRIGAARSRDRGITWDNLGIILEAPPRSNACGTENAYFVGGVGDFSVQLDAASQDLSFFYSLYLRSPMSQGVGVARLAWADRDAPIGKIMVWRSSAWLPATALGGGDEPRWFYPSATPILPALESWHNANAVVDAFWGPSVHWNTHLEQYVMLLNRAKDVDYRQEGIYVSFAPSLDNPQQWSPPAKILNGGSWYPQVIGFDEGGTDKTAGEWARFFMMGTSQQLIHFIR